MTRLPPFPVLLCAAMVGGSIGCAGVVTWRQAYAGSALFTRGSTPGRAAVQDTMPVPLVLSDCSGRGLSWPDEGTNLPVGSPIAVEVGDRCELRGTWSDSVNGDHDSTGWFNYGSFQVVSGSTCTLPSASGPVTIHVSGGFGKVHANRTVELTLAGEAASGADAGLHVDLRVSAIPDPSSKLACERPKTN